MCSHGIACIVLQNKHCRHQDDRGGRKEQERLVVEFRPLTVILSVWEPLEKPGQWWCISLSPALWVRSQEDLQDLEAILFYISSPRLARATQWDYKKKRKSWKASIQSSLPGHRKNSWLHGHDLTHLRTVSPVDLALKWERLLNIWACAWFYA